MTYYPTDKLSICLDRDVHSSTVGRRKSKGRMDAGSGEERSRRRATVSFSEAVAEGASYEPIGSHTSTSSARSLLGLKSVTRVTSVTASTLRISLWAPAKTTWTTWSVRVAGRRDLQSVVPRTDTRNSLRCKCEASARTLAFCARLPKITTSLFTASGACATAGLGRTSPRHRAHRRRSQVVCFARVTR